MIFYFILRLSLPDGFLALRLGPAHLVQHHVADRGESFRLLDACRHELEAQQELSVVLTLPASLSQIWTARKVPRKESS